MLFVILFDVGHQHPGRCLVVVLVALPGELLNMVVNHRQPSAIRLLHQIPLVHTAQLAAGVGATDRHRHRLDVLRAVVVLTHGHRAQRPALQWRVHDRVNGGLAGMEGPHRLPVDQALLVRRTDNGHVPHPERGLYGLDAVLLELQLHSSRSSAFLRACGVPRRGISGISMPCSCPILSTVPAATPMVFAMWDRITPSSASCLTFGASSARSARYLSERALLRRLTVSSALAFFFGSGLAGSSPSSLAFHRASFSSVHVISMGGRLLSTF